MIVFNVQERSLRINIFDLICLFQVNLLSRIKPTYFTISRDGIGIFKYIEIYLYKKYLDRNQSKSKCRMEICIMF